MSFGERLQTLRRANGLTQEEFAAQLKVSRQAVSKWESSRGYPEIEKIIYICNHYGASMSELFADEVPVGEDTTPPDKKPPLEHKPLKSAIGNFFSNLSPGHQLALAALCILGVLIVVTLLCTTLSKGGSNPMVYKIIWFALLVLFAAGEAVTVGLTSIWFAAGALAALVAALLGGPLWLQIGLFLVVSVLCLLAIRPLASRHLNNKVQPTNADTIIGTVAPVVEAISNLQAQGAVRIGGMVWSARSEDDSLIPVGTLVRILRIEGVKVFVEKISEEAVKS